MPVPPADAAAAEGIDEALVPARGLRVPRRRRLPERIVQHRGLVDRAVDGAGLDAHDVRHRGAERGDGLHHVRRIRGRPGRPRGKGVRGSAIDVVHSPFDRAVGVKRRAEVAQARRQVELLCGAGERLLVRPGEHRPLDWMVDEDDVGVGAALALHVAARIDHLEQVFAEPHAADEARKSARHAVRDERGGDVRRV